MLVVEDVDSTRRYIADVLRVHGYLVSEASDGLDALQKTSTVMYDAILLDLVMPNVDGWQFRRTQLRHPELAGIPTVIVTVRPLREQDQFVLQAADVIQKPFDHAALLEVVARACDKVQSPVPPQPSRPDQLFWSRRGEVACWSHAPVKDSVRWHEEQWAAIPEKPANNRVAYQCQHCPGHAGPVGHRTRSDSVS